MAAGEERGVKALVTICEGGFYVWDMQLGQENIQLF